ncbi:MAG: class I SAM-dependent methyltransferase [Gammaproteobacteria bacterium]|nr:class I SAM-dependent methyltransferase [Gammaproteobacteria bacterium]
MDLSVKYDDFYHTDLKKESFKECSVKNWPANRVEAIVAMGGTGDNILDIGCGNGYLLYQFRKSFQNLYGLEFSQQRLKQAEINLSEYVFKPLPGSAENIEALDDNCIDQIISADTIEHIPDVYAAISEMHRVLKPGGRLLINTPNVAFIKKRFQLLLGRFPSTSQSNEGIGSDILFDGGHLHYFTFRSLRILLERQGFKDLQAVGYGPLGKLHNTWPQLLSGGVQWIAYK